MEIPPQRPDGMSNRSWGQTLRHWRKRQHATIQVCFFSSYFNAVSAFSLMFSVRRQMLPNMSLRDQREFPIIAGRNKCAVKESVTIELAPLQFELLKDI